MEAKGINFLRKATPVSISLNEQGQKVVKYKQDDKESEITVDTVLFAIGRTGQTDALNLKQVGVEMADNGRIKAGDDDKTSVDNIYAIGDVVKGRIELTPTAIRAGRFLAGRLFGQETRLMNYKYVATTVFTPIEYGNCGYSQEDAEK
eukprot:TRINITY_DN22669_c0_g1_i1.p1 TRINITY_DN22669_c0_g1~~TRINITY_DN22669_c0_g1_i1.p1  ORF type:complete len:148 (-),score=19.58 TRINITY_DN22669_c0_g1_i1:304-747(-)